MVRHLERDTAPVGQPGIIERRWIAAGNHGSATPHRDDKQLGVIIPGHLVPVYVADGPGLMQVGRVAIVKRVRCIVLSDHVDGLDVAEINTLEPIDHPGQHDQDRLPGVDVARLATTEPIGPGEARPETAPAHPVPHRGINVGDRIAGGAERG